LIKTAVQEKRSRKTIIAGDFNLVDGKLPTDCVNKNPFGI
jgi:hypothetical protein